MEITEENNKGNEMTGSRYVRMIIEDFDNFTGIDQSNTSVGVDTLNGRASISSGFSFPGGGMMLKLVPVGAYRNDNSCTQVCDTTSSGDGSGKFVWQWYSGGNGWRQNTISGVKFMRGNGVLCSAIPQNPRGPGNCIPFGSGAGYGPHQGFVYKNMDPFTLKNGDEVRFDVTQSNDANCIYDMFLGHTTGNGDRTLDGNGYTQICYAADGGRGTAQRGDYMLRFAVSGISGSGNAELGHIQSSTLYQELPTIGAARMTWFEHQPQGTNIVYNMTVDGKHWFTMQNHTSHVFQHQGSHLMWNATLTTDNKDITPYIEKVIIEYDLVSVPEPKAPPSDEWQGNRTPTLQWNFTDPDTGDHQSDYIVEIFTEPAMENQIYNSSWINSTASEHEIESPLDDGIYYWRARTKDVHHAPSNFSELKKIMIDVTKPTGNITIQGGERTVNEQLVDLAIEASDNGSGVVDMQIINDKDVRGAWEQYKSTKRIALSPTDGQKTIGVRFRDNASIVSDVFNDSVYLDLKGPGNINISSPTHPDPSLYYNGTKPIFQWNSPQEETEIKGFSYVMDASKLTEPGKMLYNPNGDVRETFPGEFSGLIDGTWFFHITSCDVYDQWGNTSHFQFNIDTTVPYISDLEPDDETWYNVTSIRTSAIISDMDGFGLDMDSVEYSFMRSGEEGFSPWTSENMEYEISERGIRDNPVKATVGVDIALDEGGGNTIRWRVKDLAGNGPVISDKLIIKVDLSQPFFTDPIPSEDEIILESSLICGVTISDREGSGVDGKTIQYSISYWGEDDVFFMNWTPANNKMVKETIEMVQVIDFEEGKNVHIKWRARDAVGNPYNRSDAYRILLNSAPIPKIHSPVDGESFEEGGVIYLNATGTIDKEDDELSYYWEIKERNNIVFRGSGFDIVTSLENSGKYSIVLHVDDGRGYNESEKININIDPRPEGPSEPGPDLWNDTTDTDGDTLPDWWEIAKGLDPNDPNDATDKMKDEFQKEQTQSKKKGEPEESMLEKYWWLLAAIVCIVIILMIIILLVLKKKRKKKEEMDSLPRPAQGGGSPYSAGGHGFYQPTYGSNYGAQQSGPMNQVPGYAGVGGPGMGAGQFAFGAGYGQTALQSPATANRQLLPMHTETSVQATNASQMHQPTTSIPQYAQMGPTSPLKQPQLPSPSTGSTPMYSLPSFTSSQGTQDLNLLALPPGPEQGPAQFPEMVQQPTASPAFPDFWTSSPGIPPVNEQPLPGQQLPQQEHQVLPSVPPAMPEPAGGAVSMGIEPTMEHYPLPPEPQIPGTPSPVTPPIVAESDAPPPIAPPELPVPTTPEPPPVVSENETPPAPLSVQCHGCGSMNPVTTNERPTIISCTVCGTDGYLAE